MTAVAIGDRVEFEVNAPDDLIEEEGVVTGLAGFTAITVTVTLDNGREVEADPDWLVKL